MIGNISLLIIYNNDYEWINLFNLMEVKDLTITITSTLENGEVTINTISIPNPKIALGGHVDEKQ